MITNEKLSPSERLTARRAVDATAGLWASLRSDRQRIVTIGAIVGFLVDSLAKEYGRQETWEWLQQMADELMKEELGK